jgi:hypothetical protein
MASSSESPRLFGCIPGHTTYSFFPFVLPPKLWMALEMQPEHQRPLASVRSPMLARFSWQSSHFLLLISTAPACAFAQLPHQRVLPSAGKPNAGLFCAQSSHFLVTISTAPSCSFAQPPHQRGFGGFASERNPKFGSFRWQSSHLDLGETGPLSQGVQVGRKALRIRHIKCMEVRKTRPRGFE